MDSVNERFLIEMVNDIITEAIDHGGDSGGAYFCNEKRLVDAMKDLLRWLGKEDTIGIFNEDGEYIKFYLKRHIVK